MNKIAFIQGRLVDLVNHKIQAFPRDNWEIEMNIASKNNFKYIELTIDLNNIWENPITSSLGQDYLTEKLRDNSIKPLACTADFIMHNPPWNGGSNNYNKMQNVTKEIIKGLGNINCGILVIPFVDASSLRDIENKKAIDFLLSLTEILETKKVRVAIESDFQPNLLKEFINNLPKNLFGINYDIGNSASLGFDHNKEFEAYFNRIIHIHIKDRMLNGETVPLGEGNADLAGCFKNIKAYGYDGNFSMQTARDPSGNHVEAMLRYMEITNTLLKDE